MGIKTKNNQVTYLTIEMKIILWNLLPFPNEAFEFLICEVPPIRSYIGKVK